MFDLKNPILYDFDFEDLPKSVIYFKRIVL